MCLNSLEEHPVLGECMRITPTPPYHPGPSWTGQLATSRLAGIKTAAAHIIRLARGPIALAQKTVCNHMGVWLFRLCRSSQLA
jgi:hypothetical protein